MNGTLYIDGRRADCDGQSLALFTYRRENLDNPTVVRNSYSQQIRLAGTPANDEIFGHILQGTRITGGGFDASARTPFVLYGNGGEVLESGYCKLDTIERSGAGVTYLVTLFGGLGEILYRLSAADDGRQLSLADLDYTRPFTSPVEYIEGRGAGMINTGYVPNSSTVIEVDFSHDDTASNVPIFGNRSASGQTGLDANGVRCLTAGSDTYRVVGYGRLGSYGTITGAHQSRHVLHLEQTKATIDGRRWNLTSEAGNANTTPLVIFKGGSFQGTQVNIHIRVYSFKIWDNDQLVHDFVPVRVDTVAAFWDNITNQLYYNAGTGNLYYGDDIVPEETPDQSKELDFTLNRATLALAWEVLAQQAADDRFTVVNFAHTGDPVPSDFDPSKLFCLGDDIPQTPARTPQVQTDEAVLLSMNNTENRLLPLQVGDFRCYLQRPVLKVSAIFDAIGRYCSDQGWTLAMDGDFFKSGNPYYGASWMTLASFASLGLEQGAEVTKAALLGGTMSPLAFLVGYCRHFGLVITADHIARTLEIRTRANYYDATLPVLDLGPRVDLGEQIAVAPLTYDARWYLMGDEVAGGTATTYGEKYRTPYGWKRIDTGYAFNDEERDLLEGQPFKGAAMVQKLALGADTFYLDNQPAQYRIPAAFWAIGAASPSIATWQLARPHATGETWTGNVTPGNLQYRTLTEAVLDLTGKDGKVVDAFCLLFFDGFHAADDPDGLPASYYVSDDNAAWFDTYAGGKRCWLACGTTVTAVAQWPRFNRYTSADGEPRPTGETWDLAIPLENFAPGYDIDAASDIFDAFWGAYLADRYDIDTRVATVRADLHGLPRPAELLRHFVWWDGAIWSVNAVQEWDPLGDGTTTLELVRVKDPNNYR